MRFLLIFIFIFLNAQNLEVIKYVSNTKPTIDIEYVNLPQKLKKLISIDANIVSHYNIDFQSQIPDLTTPLGDYKANYLLRLDFKNNTLSAILYDLSSSNIIFSKRYKISSFNYYPFAIHTLNYDINQALGFKPIKWITKKLIYSVYMAPKEESIFISDITLTYRKKIISGGLNIFPKWANSKQTAIYYTKLENMPVLYKYNIFTGKKTRILSSPGMLIVSDVKGDNLLLTLAINDQPDIYKYNTKTHSLKRITKYSGIDVNGQFYDNNKIVFISDRLGYPNVYQKNLDTGSIQRVIYHGKNHVSVSAYKNKIVVSTRETNKAFGYNTFNLLLIDKNTSFVKRLTFGGKNILPTFSHDGSTIFFLKQYKFNSKLGIIRLKENKIFYFRLNKEIASFDF